MWGAVLIFKALSNLNQRTSYSRQNSDPLAKRRKLKGGYKHTPHTPAEQAFSPSLGHHHSLPSAALVLPNKKPLLVPERTSSTQPLQHQLSPQSPSPSPGRGSSQGSGCSLSPPAQLGEGKDNLPLCCPVTPFLKENKDTNCKTNKADIFHQSPIQKGPLSSRKARALSRKSN